MDCCALQDAIVATAIDNSDAVVIFVTSDYIVKAHCLHTASAVVIHSLIESDICDDNLRLVARGLLHIVDHNVAGVRQLS